MFEHSLNVDHMWKPMTGLLCTYLGVVAFPCMFGACAHAEKIVYISLHMDCIHVSNTLLIYALMYVDTFGLA